MKNRKRYLRYKARLDKINKKGFWYGDSWQCPLCEGKIFHYDKYDAECCLACDIWLYDVCDDRICPYCASRPSTPSEAIFLEEVRNRDIKDWRRRHYQHRNDGMLHHARKRQLYTKKADKKTSL